MVLVGAVTTALASVGVATQAAEPARSVAVACPEGEVPSTDFTDIAGDVHADAIACATWYAIIQGTSSTTFSPGAALERGQLATLVAALLRQAGAALPAGPDAFPDDETSVHEPAIDALAAAGIASGYADGTYRPDQPVLRAQMDSLLVGAYEYATGRELPAGSNHFDDDDGNVHEAAIDQLAEAGIVVGTGDRTFSPANELQRDQFASMIARMLALFHDEGEVFEGGASAVIDQPRVQAGTTATGHVATYRTVTGVTVSGCGLTDEPATVGSDDRFTFLVPRNTRSGACMLDITVTTTGSPSQSDTDQVEITVMAAAPTNAAPTITALGDETIDEDHTTGALPFTVGDAETAAADLTVVAASSDQALIPDANLDLQNPAPGDWTIEATPAADAFGGPATVTVTVTDAGGRATTETFDVTVTSVNDAPVLAAIGNRTVDEEAPLTFTARATDVDTTDTLTYSLSGAPSGANIDRTSGAFSWRPTEAQGGSTYTFDVIVVDDGGGPSADSETIAVTVDEVNEAPELAAVGDKSIGEGNRLSFTATATDDDLPADALTFSLAARSSGVPPGASITSRGDFSWTPTESQGPGRYTFAVVVTDDGAGTLSDSETITVTVTEMNEAPVLGSIGAKSVDEGSLLSFTATATDGDDPSDTLTFSLDPGTAGAVPPGAAITAGGAFTWTPTESQGGSTHTFDVVVTDDGAGTLSDSETITVTVNDVNSPPVLGAIGNRSVDETVKLSFTATATDGDDPADTLTFSLDGTVPAGAAITPAGVFTWTPTESQGGSAYTFDVVVTDDGTGTKSDSETITVTVNEVNQAPELASIGAKSVDEGQPLSFTATATDDDLPADTLTFSLAAGTAGAVPTGASITAGGAFTWTPSETQGGSDYTFDVVVTDDGTPSADDSETITVTVNEANDAPTFATATYSRTARSNLGLDVPDGSDDLLAGTSDSEGDTITVEKASYTTSQGGTVTVAQATGAFTYTPKAGTTGDDTFSYKVCDDGSPSSSCSVARTATLTNSGEPVWFLKAPPTGPAPIAPTGDGTLADPFETLAELNAAATTADDVLHVGPGTFDGTLTLLDRQVLLGGDASLAAELGTLPTYTPTIPAASASGSSTLTTQTSGGDTLALGTGNEVRGLSLTRNGLPGRLLAGSSAGAATLDLVRMSSVDSGGVVLAGLSAGAAFDVDVLSVERAASAAVDVAGTDHTITIGDLDLDVATAGAAGLRLRGGTFTLADTLLDSRVRTTSGIAVDLQDTVIASEGVRLNAVSSAGATTGISLVRTGTGPFTISGDGLSTRSTTGGIIDRSTGRAVYLEDTGAVTLNDLQINGGLAEAIYGLGVDSLTLDGLELRGNGNAPSEATIALTGLDGRAAVTGAATLRNLVLSTTSGATTGPGLALTRRGSDSGVSEFTVAGSTFTGFENGGIRYRVAGTGLWNGSVTATTVRGPAGGGTGTEAGLEHVVDSGFSAFHVSGSSRFEDLGGDGIVAVTRDPGRLSLSVTGTTFAGLRGDGVDLLVLGGTGTAGLVLADVTNNTFGEAGKPLGAVGLNIRNRDRSGRLEVTSTGNTFTENALGNVGIDGARGTSVTALKSRGNTYSAPTDLPGFGTLYFATQEGAKICLDVVDGAGAAGQGIDLAQNDPSVLEITQASLAALRSDNGDATVTTLVGTIGVNASCSNRVVPEE